MLSADATRNGRSDESCRSAAERDAVERQKREGNELMVSGALLGAVGAALGVVSGAVCPVCIVATPALLGLGALKRVRAMRAARSASDQT